MQINRENIECKKELKWGKKEVVNSAHGDWRQNDGKSQNECMQDSSNHNTLHSK